MKEKLELSKWDRESIYLKEKSFTVLRVEALKTELSLGWKDKVYIILVDGTKCDYP